MYNNHNNVIATAYQFHDSDHLNYGETWLNYTQLNIADCVLKLKAVRKAQDSADQLFAEVEGKPELTQRLGSLVQKIFRR